MGTLNRLLALSICAAGLYSAIKFTKKLASNDDVAKSADKCRQARNDFDDEVEETAAELVDITRKKIDDLLKSEKYQRINETQQEFAARMQKAVDEAMEEVREEIRELLCSGGCSCKYSQGSCCKNNECDKSDMYCTGNSENSTVSNSETTDQYTASHFNTFKEKVNKVEADALKKVIKQLTDRYEQLIRECNCCAENTVDTSGNNVNVEKSGNEKIYGESIGNVVADNNTESFISELAKSEAKDPFADKVKSHQVESVDSDNDDEAFETNIELSDDDTDDDIPAEDVGEPITDDDISDFEDTDEDVDEDDAGEPLTDEDIEDMPDLSEVDDEDMPKFDDEDDDDSSVEE